MADDKTSGLPPDRHPETGQDSASSEDTTKASHESQLVRFGSSSEWARRYLQRRWVPIPVPFREKAPRLAGWPDLRLREEDLPKYFDEAPGNIGVLLGEPSNGLVDLDLDAPEAVRIAPAVLAPTMTFGRESKRRSHWLYRCEAPPSSKRFRDVDGTVLVELRSTGAQTIFPGSVHPCGESIDFDTGADLHPLSPNVLDVVARGLAAITILARHWPAEGTRQDAALALAGGLHRAFGRGGDQGVGSFLSLVALGADDEELSKRVAAGDYTLKRLSSGQATTGWPRLAELVGDAVVSKVREWLGAGSGSAVTRDAPSLDRRPVLVSLADVQSETVRWLWPQRIPLGKLTVLVGDPGVGKSFATLDIAAHVSTGSPWPDYPGTRNEPKKVVILSAEDDLADTIKPRLNAAGANSDNIAALTAIRETGKDGESYFSLDRDLPALEEAIVKKNARLVIIDPVTAYLGKTDSHNNADVRGLLAPLAAMAARHNCAILAVTHLNKNEKGKAIYRAMGSLAFLAAARVAWFLGKGPDAAERRLLLPLKANVIERPVGIAFEIVAGRVRWDPSPIDIDPDALMSARGTSGSNKTNRARTWLCRMLARGPVSVKELMERAEEAGHAWRTVQRARADLGIVTRKEGFGQDGSWLWELPDDPGPPPPDLAALG